MRSPTPAPPDGRRICVIGLTGAGKSTFAGFVEELAAERGLTSARVKLAKPLYDLQDRVYAAAGAPLRPGQQDQRLMESLADSLRRIRPESLVEDFIDRLDATRADVVINDDLRDPHVDAVRLRDRGFVFVRVVAEPGIRARRLSARSDLTLAEESTRELDLIKPDVVVTNDADLASYRDTVETLLSGWWG